MATEVLGIDLDNKEILDKISDISRALRALGDEKQLTQMIEKFKQIGIAVGVIGAAAIAAKVVIDSVFEAERIKMVEAQFESLGKTFGFAADELKNKLRKEFDGFIDDTGGLKLANNAVARFGGHIERLPELFHLARNIAQATGKDFADIFNDLSMGVVTGRTKMLAGLNIIVDVNKAQKDYAESLGHTKSQLSEAGEKQATLNAVLADGNKKYKDSEKSIAPLTNAWKELKILLGNISEAFVKMVDSIFGETLANAVKKVNNLFKLHEESSKTSFKNAGDAATHEMKMIELEIPFLEKKLKSLQENMEFTGRGAEFRKSADERKADIEDLKRTIGEKKTLLELGKKAEAAAGAPTAKGAAGVIDIEKDRKQQAQFAKEMQSLRDQELASKMNLMDTEDQLTEVHNMKRRQIMADSMAQIQGIEQNDMIEREQKSQMIEQITYNRELKIREMEKQTSDERRQMYENQVRDAQNVSAGTAAAFRQGAAESGAWLKNFGKQGQMVFSSFQNNAVGALQAWGAGTKSAADAAKGFVFGMMADIAEGYGKQMMISGFLPPPAGTGPAGIAAGMAMIALSGLLRSKAGGGGSSIGDTGGGGGGGSYGSSADNKPQVREDKKAMTQIVVQGSWFDTKETERRVTELIRSSQDSSDFTLTRIT